MALFKILRGKSSKISIDDTPFHDGYAYFTPDDGGFYIDATHDGIDSRIRINPTTTAVNVTLLASGWSNGFQSVVVHGMAANQNGVIGLSQNISNAQILAAKEAELYIYGQSTESLTVAVGGITPQIDIPVTVILFG